MIIENIIMRHVGFYVPSHGPDPEKPTRAQYFANAFADDNPHHDQQLFGYHFGDFRLNSKSNLKPSLRIDGDWRVLRDKLEECDVRNIGRDFVFRGVPVTLEIGEPSVVVHGGRAFTLIPFIGITIDPERIDVLSQYERVVALEVKRRVERGYP